MSTLKENFDNAKEDLDIELELNELCNKALTSLKNAQDRSGSPCGNEELVILLNENAYKIGTNINGLMLIMESLLERTSKELA